MLHYPLTHTLILLPDTLRGASASFKTNGHRTGVYSMRKSAAVTVGQNSDLSEFCPNPVANNQATPRRQYDSFEVCKLDKSTTGAISGSNISVHTTCGASFPKKSKGSHTEKDTPKIENGSEEALRPVPGVVDSLESQNLEKPPNTGSDGFYTIGYTQNAVDFNKKPNGGRIKNPAPEIENLVSTDFRGAPVRYSKRIACT